jgi:hypothetical protein
MQVQQQETVGHKGLAVMVVHLLVVQQVELEVEQC